MHAVAVSARAVRKLQAALKPRPRPRPRPRLPTYACRRPRSGVWTHLCIRELLSLRPCWFDGYARWSVEAITLVNSSTRNSSNVKHTGFCRRTTFERGLSVMPLVHHRPLSTVKPCLLLRVFFCLVGHRNSDDCRASGLLA
jgi:hypothetical protein